MNDSRPGTWPHYHHEQVQTRRVANDALVTVGAARYSVPVEFVGQTVSVHEGLGYYEFFHHQRLIARHRKAVRHSVVMEPAHYAGLLCAGSNKAAGTRPPRFDPYFGQLGEVMVRDLKLYEIISQSEGGADR
jgi:hypothetical protein